jgi:hypothetical protein
MVANIAAMRKYLTILNALTRDHLKVIAVQAKKPSPADAVVGDLSRCRGRGDTVLAAHLVPG